MNAKTYPLPAFYDPAKTDQVWQVPYQERAAQAVEWRAKHGIRPYSDDEKKVALLLIDVQNTFCIPEFELFVGGRTGHGAVEDNQRLTELIYHNLGHITQIFVTMDTHQPMQIFHAAFFVDENGQHPPANTQISVADVEGGKWRVNPRAAQRLGISLDYAQEHLLHYVRTLAERHKFDLTVWPYHAMIGGIGHALVSSVEEAVFFHSLARGTEPRIEIKGWNALTEHYSAMQPEVQHDAHGKLLGSLNKDLLEALLSYDAVIVAGQAKSHCVNWTVGDILAEIQRRDPDLAGKFYLLEDCASAVVIPGVVDFTDVADDAYARYEAAGMHVVRSSEMVEEWDVEK